MIDNSVAPYFSLIQTPLGYIRICADDFFVHTIEFVEGTSKNTDLLKHNKNALVRTTEKELKLYFLGELKKFSIPVAFSGTDFRRQALRQLTEIPYGSTISYKEQAEAMRSQGAYRAAANANGSNKIVIVVPCHRVICSNGDLGGYSAGLERKKWLLNHENLILINS